MCDHITGMTICTLPTTLYYIAGSYEFRPNDLGYREYCREHAKVYRFNFPRYCFDTREEAEMKLILELLFGDP